MSRDFIIVRHSERLDEVAPEEWIQSVKNNNSFRDKYSLENDTPITAAGVDMAADAAKTVRDLLIHSFGGSEALPNLNIRIYSSRLMRCVQTAHQIARELDRPVHISCGLSLTAVAVGRRKNTFQFQRMDELQELCPGTELHCSDDDHSLYRVSKSHWARAISSIVSRNEINIIVAHRETIRNLLGERFRLPYCCIGVFSWMLHERTIMPKLLLDKDGRLLEDYTLPIPEMTTVGAVTGESQLETNP
jgi:broad specificity phosphatase PhoE